MSVYIKTSATAAKELSIDKGSKIEFTTPTTSSEVVSGDPLDVIVGKLVKNQSTASGGSWENW